MERKSSGGEQDWTGLCSSSAEWLCFGYCKADSRVLSEVADDVMTVALSERTSSGGERMMLNRALVERNCFDCAVVKPI